MSVLDDILDQNLDDLADMPEFVVPPAGAYNASILSVEEKEINDHPAVEVKFRFLETLELANESDTPVANGTEASTSFMMDNEFGVGAFKELLKPIQTATGLAKTREIVAAMPGMQVMVVTKVRFNKDKTQKYLAIDSLEVL